MATRDNGVDLPIVAFPPAARPLLPVGPQGPKADTTLGLDLVHPSRRRRQQLQALLDATAGLSELRPCLAGHLLMAGQVTHLHLLQQVVHVRPVPLPARQEGQVAQAASSRHHDEPQPAPHIAEEDRCHTDHLRLEHVGQDESAVRVQDQHRDKEEHGRTEHDDAPIHPSLRVHKEDYVGDRHARPIGPTANDQLVRGVGPRRPPLRDRMHRHEQQPGMHDTPGDPTQEHHRVEVPLVDAQLVQARHEERHARGDIDVEHTNNHHRQRSEGQIESRQQVRLVQGRAAEPVERGIERQWQHEQEVLVEGVADDNADAPQVPAPVHKEKRLQEAELPDREVRRIGSLPALHAQDADADIGFLNHARVIASVADGQCHRIADDAPAD
mmetsp:Transcript_25988/g.75050  ORF Transcript_25988/g.75050 Transcript_25988/m.75050 type:complete len:384 (+) Transcript_25988:2256-3407(+)